MVLLVPEYVSQETYKTALLCDSSQGFVVMPEIDAAEMISAAFCLKMHL